MAEGTVLVTGAAGGLQGKTGRRVTELLRERGVPARAMVRTPDDRAEYLRGLGAEVVVGDFLDFGSIEKAVDGMSTVYFDVPAANSYSVIGQVLTVKEIVAAMARGLGRPVAYQDVSDQAWAEAARPRINAHAVAHLSRLWATFRTRPAQYEVTDTIEKLGGRKPKTFAGFLAEEKLTSPAQGDAQGDAQGER